MRYTVKTFNLHTKYCYTHCTAAVHVADVSLLLNVPVPQSFLLMKGGYVATLLVD